MKRISLFFIVAVFLLVGCGSGTKTWQDHYDLGMRYLSEGNYEEAILSFTAAIEIDDKRIEAFIGRGDAYFAFDELEEHFESAIADFETALGLDEMYVDAYLKLADVYFAIGDFQVALDILKNGYEITNNDRLIEKMADEGYYFIKNVEAIIFANEDQYRQEIDSSLPNYEEAAFDQFGIRFNQPVVIEELKSNVKEAVCLPNEELDHLLFDEKKYDGENWYSSYNMDILNKPLIVSGYFSYDDKYERVSWDEWDDEGFWLLRPNGPYSYNITDWCMK